MPDWQSTYGVYFNGNNNVAQPTMKLPLLSSFLHFFAGTNPQFQSNGGLGRWDITGEVL
jgi:hypothetical protein